MFSILAFCKNLGIRIDLSLTLTEHLIKITPIRDLLVPVFSILTYPTKFSAVFSTKSTVWPWKNLDRTLPDLNSLKRNGQFQNNIIDDHDNFPLAV